jgi:Golgi nucleoside diphosphatase
MDGTKLPLEDKDSWENHVERRGSSEPAIGGSRRVLKHHPQGTKDSSLDLMSIEQQKEEEFWASYQENLRSEAKAQAEDREARQSRIHELSKSSGIAETTVHGLMIDAGSTGSRLHVYEWKPRILRHADDIEDAVSGNMLSFPGTESRWTDRLQPGLSSFAGLSDDELLPAIGDYLRPLLDFAKAVLHTKEGQFEDFPIFLRATAGMRILEATDRARIIRAVRQLFQDKTYCPFAFTNEQARVLSGEEEAIYDWSGVNFLMGDLIKQSEGAGTVVNPRKTHGALDLGGGSTQISFYEHNEDIMSNLFKLQIGQAKHWNVYAHSFLFYGMNEAIHRFRARLVAGKDSRERLVDGVYNPCLPGGTKVDVRTNIHLTNRSMETWEYSEEYEGHDGFYQAVLKNDGVGGDPDHCFELAKDLLHLEQNQWCEFAHNGDCSLAGVYQPALPTESDSFVEFVAFSNYHHVWKFLKLPDLASIAQLEEATRYACSLSHDELVDYAIPEISKDDLDSYCFRSAYVFQLLHNGFGFRMNDTIRATNVIKGHKVGWALGAMLYEINALPWRYEAVDPKPSHGANLAPIHLEVNHEQVFLFGIVVFLLASLCWIFASRERRLRSAKYEQYEVVKDTEP